jgi:hypothetical protein
MEKGGLGVGRAPNMHNMFGHRWPCKCIVIGGMCMGVAKMARYCPGHIHCFCQLLFM